MSRLTTDRAPETLNEFAALLDAAVDAIIVICERGFIEEFNQAAEKLFGYSRNEVLGENVKILMPEPFHSRHDNYLRHHLTTGERKIIGTGREVTGLRADSSTFPLYLSVGRAHSENTTRFVGILHDLSERHDFETEIARQRQELSRINRQATAGELAAALAHELNQPLSAISTYSGAARRFLAKLSTDNGTSNADIISKIDAALSSIETQSLRAGDVIHRIRTFIGTKDTERHRISIQNLIEEIMPIIHLDARSEGVLLATEFEDTGEYLDVDKIQIQQVLLNLVRNAVDATAANSATETKRVTIRVSRPDRLRIKLSVKDTGPGISEDFVDQLFVPFQSTKKNGLGMGLAISDSIVRNHGSELKFHSTPKGAEFYFFLPVFSN